MATYATWNPSDKDANITLSGGNLIATAGSAWWSNVRANIWVSSGKWYWEVTLTAWTTEAMAVVATLSASLSIYPGGDAFWYGYYNVNGNKFNNTIGSWYGTSFATNDVIGVALDMTAGTIIFYKNNVSQWVAYTGLSGTIYPMVGVAGIGRQFTANFWATTMAYTAPSGYNQGLYSGTLTNSAFFMFL